MRSPAIFSLSFCLSFLLFGPLFMTACAGPAVAPTLSAPLPVADQAQAAGSGLLGSGSCGHRRNCLETPTRYTFTLISGPVPGGLSVQLFGINDRGQVVGSETLQDGTRVAFLYDHGKVTALPIPAPLPWSVSAKLALNEQGVVLGPGAQGPAEVVGNRIVPVSKYPDTANSINNARAAAGTHCAAFPCTGALFASGRSIDMPGAVPGVASAINERGVIAGTRDPHAFMSHAVLWTDAANPAASKLTDLDVPPLAHTHASVATALNDLNPPTIVGYVTDDTETHHAVRFAVGASPTILGNLTYSTVANGLNDADEIVGVSGTQPTTRAFLVTTRGELLDLNMLVAPGSFVLRTATGINNHHEICGQASSGIPGGGTVGFLLTPLRR